MYNYFIMVIEYSKKVFFAPNTSDQEIVEKAKKVLIYNGINDKDIQINYNTNELEEGDLYISYDPPDLVIRNVYQKKSSGIIKMKSCTKWYFLGFVTFLIASGLVGCFALIHAKDSIAEKMIIPLIACLGLSALFYFFAIRKVSKPN